MMLQTWYRLIIGALLCYSNPPGPIMVMAHEANGDEETIHVESKHHSSDFQQDHHSSSSSTSSSHHDGSWEETTEYRSNEQPWFQETGLFPRIRKGLVVLNDEQSIQSFRQLSQPPSSVSPPLNIDDSEIIHREHGTLFLIVFYESWCEHSHKLLQAMEKASSLLNNYFLESADNTGSNDAQFLNLQQHHWDMPILAKFDTSRLSSETQSLFQLGDIVDQVPFLSFILVEPSNARTTSSSQGESVNKDIDRLSNYIHSMEYIGSQKNPAEIVETILFIWTRFILSSQLEQEALASIQNEFDTDERGIDNWKVVIPSKPVFLFMNTKDWSNGGSTRSFFWLGGGERTP